MSDAPNLVRRKNYMARTREAEKRAGILKLQVYRLRQENAELRDGLLRGQRRPAKKLPKELQPIDLPIFEHAPTATPCVYFLTRRGRVVYVGQSVDLESRLKSHRWAKDFDRVFYSPVNPNALTTVEAGLIRLLRPALNKQITLWSDK